MIKNPKWQVFCRRFKIFLCFLDSDTSDDIIMILSHVSEFKKHKNMLKWRQKTCHFGFLIIHFNSKSRYLQNLIFFVLAISRSIFAQIQWSWTFLNSRNDEQFQNVQNIEIWVIFHWVIKEKLREVFFPSPFS